MSGRIALLAVAILSSGLMAGLLFGWMASVIPGTSRVDDRTYVSTMQSINVAIINPVFVIPFMLTPLALAIAGIVQYRAGEHRRGILLLSAAGTYLFGVLAVTMAGNVPLNNALAAFDLGSSGKTDTATQRTAYERPWNRWHIVRTVASIIAFTMAGAAALVEDDAA